MPKPLGIEANANRAKILVLVLPVLVGLLAVAVRVYRFDSRSLWLDEILTAQTAHLAGPADVIAWCQAAINQMPSYYLFTWFLGRWGDDAILLRLPALVAGVLTVLAVYLLGNRLFGYRAGAVASLLMALMPFAVWYSQEARNYSFLMLLTTLQMYFAHRAVVEGRAADWLALSLITTADLYTHYLALVSTAAMALYVGLFLVARLLGTSAGWTRTGIALALVLLGAGTALSPWRSLLRSGYRYLAELVAGPLRSVTGAALLAALVAALAGLTAFVRRRPVRFKLAACAGLLAVLLLLVAILRPGPLGPAGARVQLRFVILLAAVGAAFLLALIVLLLHLLDPDTRALRMLTWVLLAGGLAALLYLPWLPTLRVFISRPDQSILRFAPRQGASLGEVLAMLDRLGLSGLLLVMFVVGLVALAAGFVTHRREAGLLLCWIFLPVALTWVSVRWAIVDIDVRYFAALVPAIALVVAEAVLATASLLSRVLSMRPDRPQWARPAALSPYITLGVVALLLAQVVPALAASYQVNKDDYRATAKHIAAGSGSGSVVLALGDYSDWTVICLRYYFNELHAPVTVVEGKQVDGDLESALVSGSGPVWGVVIFPSPAQSALLSQTMVRTDFTDVTGNVRTVRATAGGSPAEQAKALLDWESTVQPQLGAQSRLLDALGGRARLGAALVPDPGPAGWKETGWTLPRGAGAGQGILRLTAAAAGAGGDATFAGPIPAAGDYAVSVEYRNGELMGTQRAYLLLLDGAGHTLSTWPGGSGFDCVHTSAWRRATFAFAAPAEASSFSFLLRADGSGSAEFRGPQLNRIEEGG